MPVDPGIRTTHLCHRISECVLLTGTRSAESIMASGHRVPHQQAGHMAAPTSLASPSKKPLPKGSRPHMADSVEKLDVRQLFGAL